MPSSIKLTYFDARGRAETSRLILAYAGVDYQDERLSSQTLSFMTRYIEGNISYIHSFLGQQLIKYLGEQFSELKPSLKYGQVVFFTS